MTMQRFHLQLMSFASDRATFANFFARNNIAMKNLLLRDWITFYETMPYPPATGDYAIYRIDDLINHINHTVQMVFWKTKVIVNVVIFA